jgi:hypothetical protein
MSIWARLFGRSPRVLPGSTEVVLSETEAVARRLLSNDANKQIVLGSLERLEAAGLRIRPALDRDLIVVRFLRSFADMYEADDLTSFFADSRNSLDLIVFWGLASETDAFFGFDHIDTILPKLSAVSDEALSDMLDEHAFSIFENAAAVCIVNEHGPGEYVPQRVGEVAGLACGDFGIESITESKEARRLIGCVTLSDGQSGTFELIHEKRPDLTPLFKAMNSLAAPLGIGRFVAVLTGSNEDLIAVYLRPSEQTAFRIWEARQYCAGGPAPVDWFN